MGVSNRRPLSRGSGGLCNTVQTYLQRELEAECLDLGVEDGEDLGLRQAVGHGVNLELLLNLYQARKATARRASAARRGLTA